MRHQKAGKKFNRTGSHRDAMFRNMVTSLFTYGKVRTTDAKAKELRRWADKMITLAKRGDLHARRQALTVVRSKDVVHKLFEEVAERFGKRAGGYTRIIKIGRRTGDGALLSLVEFVGSEEKEEKKKKKKKTKAAKKAAPKPKKETAAKSEVKEEAAPEKAEAEEAPKEEAADETTEAVDEQVDAAAPEAEVTGENAESEEPAGEPKEDKEKTE